MNDFLTQFPLVSKCTYLNTAYTGLLPAQTYSWRRKEDKRFFDGGSQFRAGHKELFIQLRNEAAGLFGTQPQNVAFTPNFSYGFNVLLDGLRPGQKILLLKEDYPSVNWAVEQRDFRLCYASIDEKVEKNILEAVRRDRPDIFAFSPVHYISGIRIHEQFLHNLKEEFPEMMLIADGTQYLGTLDFNFDHSPLDVIGSSGYKWMLSGFGNGLFMFKPQAQKCISPGIIGFNSADSVEGKMESIPFFGHFEPGHQDTLAFGSMLQSLRYLKRLGMNNIEVRIHELTTYAYKRLAELDLVDDALMSRPGTSPIIQTKMPVSAEDLQSKGIICSQRGDGLRLSFHFYNRKEDVDKLIDVLRTII